MIFSLLKWAACRPWRRRKWFCKWANHRLHRSKSINWVSMQMKVGRLMDSVAVSEQMPADLGVRPAIDCGRCWRFEGWGSLFHINKWHAVCHQTAHRLAICNPCTVHQCSCSSLQPVHELGNLIASVWLSHLGGTCRKCGGGRNANSRL